MHVCRGQRIEIGVAAGRRELRPAVAALYDAGDRAGRAAGGERVEQRDRGALAIAGHRVVDAKRVEERLGRDPERGTARDHAGARRGGPQRREERGGLGRVMPERDEIAVVDVPHRDTDDVGRELARGGAGRGVRVAREREIEHARLVPRCLERARDTGDAVRYHRHRLAFAVRAHEEHARRRTGGERGHAALRRTRKRSRPPPGRPSRC